MVEAQGSFWRRRRRLVWIGGTLLVVFIVAAVAIDVVLHRAEPYLHALVIEELEERFHAKVQLDSFHVSLIDGLWAEGRGLRIWPPGEGNTEIAQSDQPLIRLAEFRFHAPLHYEPGKPFYISLVQLEGLDIDVPPKVSFSRATPAPHQQPRGTGALQLQVGTIECTRARLAIETGRRDSAPLVFLIAHFKLTGVNQGMRGMGFEAELTNPRPRGTVHSRGRFGPWSVDDPGATPIAGQYRFEHADLSSFKGIAGTLKSTGEYEGTLRQITIDGDTETPDFRLSSGGQAMNLRTRFHALVDGMNGDTRLQTVAATLGHSHLTAEGDVLRVPARSAANGKPGRPGGHDVALKVNVAGARIEDFLRLAARGEPLLDGALTMQTYLHVPPGADPVARRMRLNGKFALADARFTNKTIQDRIEELSMRGQGKPKQHGAPSDTQVRSAMQGNFKMANDVVTLPDLRYVVPGAEIDLKGDYGVDGGALNFTGKAKMQATISKIVGGWKGLLLTPLDPFFEKEGAGTVVPLTIKGTRQNPQLSIDFGRLKKTVPQRPGESAGTHRGG